MYAIRVRPGNKLLEATLSGATPTAEALRAVSQAFALAEAGAIQRILADVTLVEDGTDWPIVAATLRERLDPPLRLAVICTSSQLQAVRRFATQAAAGSNVGVFTRAPDAEAWLASNPAQRLPQTTALHFNSPGPAAESPAPTRRTGAA